jgi:hypothetical protein
MASHIPAWISFLDCSFFELCSLLSLLLANNDTMAQTTKVSVTSDAPATKNGIIKTSPVA